MLLNLFRFYLLILAISCLTLSSHAAPAWEQIHQQAGIKVYQRDSTLGDLPDFKAIGRINANLFDLIAVLQDVNRRTEWVHRCSASKMLKKCSEFELLLYHKTDSPWPISDRDAAIRTHLFELKKERRYLAYFKGIKSSLIPKKNGIVRLPQIEGYYLFDYINPQELEVTYFVHLDPGGSLPHWIVKRATKNLPTKTIIGLRNQIAKTRAAKTYRAFHKKWNPKHRPADVAEPSRPPYPAKSLLKRLGIKG